MSELIEKVYSVDDKSYEDYESEISYDEAEKNVVFIQSLSQAADVDCSDETVALTASSTATILSRKLNLQVSTKQAYH